MNTQSLRHHAARLVVLTLLAAALIASPLSPVSPLPGFLSSASAADTTSHVTLRVDVHGTTREIVIELDETNTPKTSANFKKLAASGFYDGIAFHRVIPNYIVQAGDPLTKSAAHKDLWGTGGPGYTLQAEIGLNHERGSIAMARLGDSVNANKASSGSQFYIALARLPKLDRKYTVFGKVVSGLEHLDQISKSPTDSNNNPSERIEIVASSATGNIPTTIATASSQLATPPAMPKLPKAAKTSKSDKAATADKTEQAASAAMDSVEPEAKKKSWFKRKFGSKKKNNEEMAAVDESTPPPTPVKASKPAKKSTASTPPAPVPAPTPTSPKAPKAATPKPASPSFTKVDSTGGISGNDDPTYRNDNKADARSAMTAPPAVESDDAGISLSDEMKMKSTKDDAARDVAVREEKDRSFFGRLIYRYW